MGGTVISVGAAVGQVEPKSGLDLAGPVTLPTTTGRAGERNGVAASTSSAAPLQTQDSPGRPEGRHRDQ
jgi:hypothetical protein